jgi:O-antigen ligase
MGLLGLVYGIGLWFRRDPSVWLRALAVTNLGILALTIFRAPSSSGWDFGLLRGPFLNPNSLGSALALTLPALLWLREEKPRQVARPIVWLILSGAVAGNVVTVVLTRSRASISVVALVLVLYAVLRASRLAAFVSFLAVVVALASPGAARSIAVDAVYKGRESGQAFALRQEEFKTTLEAALSSPIYGYGFGTSKGVTTWSGGLTATTAGREKTNAYLGTMEEVGLIGALPLTLGVLGALWMGLIPAWRSRRTSDGAPAALFIIVATAALHTNFEAWLTSMGSFEAFFFWSTLGVMLMSVCAVPRAIARSI